MREVSFPLLAGLALLTMLATPVAGAAATANFQGNCSNSGSNIVCSFDAQRPSSNPSSCPGSFIWKYSWDYGDGTSSGLTGTNPVSHTYTPPLQDYLVKLTVYCWDGNTPTKTRATCFFFGTVGCIQLGVGWN